METLYEGLIPTFCLKVNENIYPFWELDFVEDKDECLNTGYKIKGSNQIYYSHHITPCYWDFFNKKIVFGKIKDFYPTKLNFEKEEVILVDVEYSITGKHSCLRQSKIVDIKYEDYSTEIIKIKSTENGTLIYYFGKDNLNTLNLEDIYEIRNWKPWYILEDGEVIKWDHKLHHIFVY